MTDTVDSNQLDPSAGDATQAPRAEAPEAAEQAVRADASDHADPSDPDTDADAEGDEESGAEGEGADASGEGEKKKRRRRRRKKKKGAPGEGEAVAAAAAAPSTGSGETAKKKEPHHPFQRLFDGAAPRRHAFAVGEIVAGRVAEVREDVAVVDLFGKATAFTRAHEPRDIPVAVETPEADTAEEETTAEAGAPEAVAAESAPEAPAGEVTAAAPEAAPAEAASDADAPAGEAAAIDADDLDADDEEKPAEAAGREPLPAPAYVLQPEGVPVIDAGGIFRGRVGAVAESGHIALVNENIDVKTTRAYLRRAKEDRTRVPGLVFGYNRGGFDVLVFGLRAFCPVSGMTMEMVDDPEPILGQWAQFHVQAAKSGAQGLVVSRRSILEKEARKRAKHLLKSLAPGQTVRGRVTQVREYGLFVDIGGIEGLLHQSELSWERGVKPEDVAKVGDEIDVQILKVHERESKRERHDRVSLSTKALQPDPWKEQVDQLVEGQPRKGTVVRTAEFGAFVQLAPGVDGLLHISELGRELKHASEAVQVGEEIHVVVERIDRKARRVSLSRLSAEDAEAFEKGELVADSGAGRVKQGGHVRVRVTQVGSAGLHVQVDNVVGKRGRGFIPNAEMGTPRGTDHRRQFAPGTEIDVLVIGTDRDGGLRCSRKRYLMDEERRAVREYRKEVSKQGLGTFGDLLRQKLGVDR
jgi:small subunit ribosomal protein S1